jgi:tetratricopeptide (TPR) repeat protein
MIDVDRLEERLENSLTEDLRVYRSAKAPSPPPGEALRPEPRREPRPEPRPERPRQPRAVVRPAPWREATPEPPRERRRERRRGRREEEEAPALDAGFVVIRPEARPAPRPEPRWDPRPEAAPAAPTRGGTDDFVEPNLNLAGHAARVANLLAEGDRAGAEYHVAAHTALAGRQGGPAGRRDAAALATMVALLDGREAEARAGSDAVLVLGREADDPKAADRHWAQRMWVVLEWGREDEHGELLDYCRERAYRDDDTTWMGAISLLLARSGRVDEARAAFDAAGRVLETAPGSAPERSGSTPAWLDLATDLAEAAALLGDAGRAATVTRALARTAVPLVAVGRPWVCKGATARYRGLLAAALGRWDEADREYRAATELHRRLEAGPLLARTLVEWGRVLQGRDDLRSRSYLQEGAELGRRLALADFVARSAERAS